MYIKKEVTFEKAKKLIKKGEAVYLSGNEARGVGKTQFIIEWSNKSGKPIIVMKGYQKKHLVERGAENVILVNEPWKVSGLRLINGALVDERIDEETFKCLKEANVEISGFIIEDVVE